MRLFCTKRRFIRWLRQCKYIYIYIVYEYSQCQWISNIIEEIYRTYSSPFAFSICSMRFTFINLTESFSNQTFNRFKTNIFLTKLYGNIKLLSLSTVKINFRQNNFLLHSIQCRYHNRDEHVILRVLMSLI